jgi:hypothetical protein
MNEPSIKKDKIERKETIAHEVIISENQLMIHSEKFNIAKKRLKELVNNNLPDVNLPTVETDGWFFGMGDRKVTGSEFNNRLNLIQKIMIDLKNLHILSTDEITEIYNVIHALDEEYIPAILTNIKAVEVVAFDIEKAIKVLKKTVDTLYEYKNKIDRYEHLEKIDDIWDYTQENKKNIKSIHSKIKNLKEKLTKDMKSIINEINDSMEIEKTKQEEQTKQLHKKFKIACMIAGGSLGITLITIVLNILGII